MFLKELVWASKHVQFCWVTNVLVCKKSIIKKYNSLSSTKPGFIKIPYQIDIDSLEDFKYAEYKIKRI